MRYILTLALLLAGCAVSPDTTPITPEPIDFTGIKPSLPVSPAVRELGNFQKTAKNCTCFDCQCNKLKDNPACTCPQCKCDDEPQAKTYTGPYVEVHTSAYCGPCQTWKQVELPPLVNNGWVVGKHIRIVEYGQSGWPGSLPLYRFYRRGKLVHEQSGYMSRASIGDVFDRTQNVGREVIQSRAARQHEAVYRGARRPLLSRCVGGVCW